MSKFKKQKAQVLVEILIALGIAVVVFSLITYLVQTSESSVKKAEIRTTATQISQEGLEAINSIARENWHQIFNTNPSQEYYPKISDGKWILSTTLTDKTITLKGKNYDRWLIIEPVSRDAAGNIETNYNPANRDPSTQKVTIHVLPQGETEIIWQFYLSRWSNEVDFQTDWSGGPGSEGPVTSFGSGFSSSENIKFDEAGQIILSPP
jgi:type II secretory pathway pseudopilin PulG